MRKGFNGLYGLVSSGFSEDPRSGALYVFCNRRHTRIKVLYFDGTGLWVLSKTDAPQCPQRLLTGFLSFIRTIHIMDKLLKCSDRAEDYGTWCISVTLCCPADHLYGLEICVGSRRSVPFCDAISELPKR
jgi:hypothetical protein